MKFISDVWHPNVYPDGRVCISILHPPGDDKYGYEDASERWYIIIYIVDYSLGHRYIQLRLLLLALFQ